MSVEETQEVMTRYFAADHGDASMMAEDVVFTDMATGQESHGREGVLEMLHWIYHVAFDATATPRNTIFSEDNAVWEGTFSGRHIGEFAGIAATHREVEVPLTVVYEIEDSNIARARIYMLASIMMQQLGAI